MKHYKTKTNQRQYIRISTVLPVEFYVEDKDGRQSTPWLQGFTRDISKGGVKLIVNDLWCGFWDRFNYRDARLFLKINLPFTKKVISTQSKVSWVDISEQKDYSRFCLGVEFLRLSEAGTKFLFKYAVFKKIFPRVIATTVIFFITVSLGFFYKSKGLIRENRQVVIEKSSQLETLLRQAQEKDVFFKQRQKELNEKIVVLEKEITRWQERYERSVKGNEAAQEEKKSSPARDIVFRLRKELAALLEEQELLKVKRKELTALSSKEQ